MISASNLPIRSSAFIMFRERRNVYIISFKGFTPEKCTVETNNHSDVIDLEQVKNFAQFPPPAAKVVLEGHPFMMHISKNRMRPAVAALMNERARDLSVSELLILAEHKHKSQRR